MRFTHSCATTSRIGGLPVSFDFERVFADATELSRKHSARFLTRSLDLLHIATAHAVGCHQFVSADDRQLTLAKASGLTAVDIKRTRGRQRS